MIKIKIEKIVWDDSWSTDSWMDDIELKPHLITTFGHVIKEDNHSVCTVKTFSHENDMVTDILCIPIKNIVFREVIWTGDISMETEDTTNDKDR